MKPSLSARIALRYLLSRNSHSAVTAISAVTICGVAVATCAIICVLSVFNGFLSTAAGRLDTFTPELIVEPAHGKVLAAPDSVLEVIASHSNVAVATPTLTDKALLLAQGMEEPVTVKGIVTDEYARALRADTLVMYGEYIRPGAGEDALISIGVASSMGIYPDNELLLFAPRREGRINLSNPAMGFVADSLRVSGIFQTNQAEFDNATVIVPIDRARELFQYDDASSAIEIRLKPGTDPVHAKERISAQLGSDYTVKTRLEQQEVNFRMIEIEKWVTFLLLFFILIIASFNLISAMAILALEKEPSVEILRALGMSAKRTPMIFAWESLLVGITGGIAGLVLGVILCLIQQYFGIIHIAGDPGTLVIDTYPVNVKWSDCLLTLVPVIVISLAAAVITYRGVYRKIKLQPQRV